MATRRQPDAKTHSLRAHGALNPRPDAVHDELFDGAFFDPRDIVQVRYEMLRRVRTDGRSVSAAATRFGVSRPTFYKVLADFGRDGLPGLVPRKRGPKGGHKITAEVLTAIERARAEDGSMDAAALVDVVRARFGRDVHPRTVERALARRKKNSRGR